MQKSEFDSSMSMQPEFVEQHSSSPANDQMFQAITTMMMQVNHTNQTLMNWLTNQSQLTTKPEKQKDSRIRPRSFSGLPTEDILAWLDHFENVAGYHEWDDGRKALELRTVLEHVAATWFIQQPEEIKRDWPYLREQLVQQFANNDVTQTALQQLDTLRQQPLEPVAQFAVKLKQLLLRVDPHMKETMKLYFLLPRLRHDIARRVKDQGPTTFQMAIQIAQRIESPGYIELQHAPTQSQQISQKIPMETTVTPMEIDVQNAQFNTRKNLSDRDSQGRPQCFYCNSYGHVKKHCRKFAASKHHQNVQIHLADSTSLAEVPGNGNAGC